MEHSHNDLEARLKLLHPCITGVNTSEQEGTEAEKEPLIIKEPIGGGVDSFYHYKHYSSRYLLKMEAERFALEVKKAEAEIQLDLRRFNKSDKPVAPQPVLSLGDHVICTAGNISVTSAKSKEGKTAAISSIMGAAMNPNAPREHLLDFRCCSHDGKIILHFDTEQSPYDHYRMVERSLRRAGLVEPPTNLESYCLSGVDLKDRSEMLEVAMERAGNIFIVLIDGIGDFINDPNNGPEAFDLVARLHQLAIQYDCPILSVLHENPGSESGKTRGHLGSHLERKAETNLRLSKVDGVTTMWVERGRHCTIPKEHGIRFYFSEEDKMHVLAPPQSELKANDARAKLKPFALSVYEGTNGELSWTELRNRIAEIGPMTESGARKKMDRMIAIQLIEATVAGKYVLVDL